MLVFFDINKKWLVAVSLVQRILKKTGSSGVVCGFCLDFWMDFKERIFQLWLMCQIFLSICILGIQFAQFICGTSANLMGKGLVVAFSWNNVQNIHKLKNYLPPLIGGFPLYMDWTSSSVSGSPRLFFSTFTKFSSVMKPLCKIANFWLIQWEISAKLTSALSHIWNAPTIVASGSVPVNRWMSSN